MLIQTESLTVINTTTISFVPVTDISNNVDHYDAVTPSLRALCSVTPRECEVILLMEAAADDVSAMYGKVLRTPEWGVVNGILNYRYGHILAEKITGSTSDTNGLIEWLHAKTESSRDEAIENKIDLLIMLNNLAEDHEFFDMTEEGRKILMESINSYRDSTDKIKTILERWNDIFIELPF